VQPLVRQLEFRGSGLPLAGGILLVNATSQDGGGREALLETRITLLDEDRFEEHGSISFGGVDAIRFRSLQPGLLTATAADGLRHGGIVLSVDRGSGTLAGATGRITSRTSCSATPARSPTGSSRCSSCRLGRPPPRCSRQAPRPTPHG
jgi:hypothetical protein